MRLAVDFKYKDQIVKVIWITFAWTLVSIWQFYSAHTTLSELNCELGSISPWIHFKGSLITGILAGILGGSSLVFVWEKWLRNKRYGTALLLMFITYCFLYVTISLATGLYFESHELSLPFYAPEIWIASISNISSISELPSFSFWLFMVIATLIVFQVSDKYGPGVFRSFLLGKYFHPQREERIFMFLDLRSSTTIAEKLGEVQYFNFLKEVFKEVTPAILNAKGEIYQYVGDEIVVSWKMKTGIENDNCINCFFQVQLTLNNLTDYFQKKYNGIKPVFKAGLHYGHVMAGEIGVVKREIAYSGDVLNTTARIQSKCNELGVDILISKYLLDKLKLKSHSFHPKKIGDLMLRGKENKVMLFTL